MSKLEKQVNPLISFLTKKRLICILISSVHALWLLIFTFIWLNQSSVYDDEKILIQITSVIKRLVFKMDKKPNKNDFLFINVAYDKEIVPKLDNEGIPIGNQAVTDRNKLARFFHILNQKPNTHKFILCDIFFKDPSPSNDNLLLAELKQVKNILIPYHTTASGQSELPIFPVKKGLSDYKQIKDMFLKFSLMYKDKKGNALKTISLLMYEKLHQAEFQNRFFGYAVNNKYSLNSTILDFRIRNYDLIQSKRYFYINLGNLLKISDDVVLEMVKDRIIVIGDFEDRDMHKTVFGDIAGPLILINAYLCLVNEDNIITINFLFSLFLVYLFISYYIFFGKKTEENQKIEKIFKSTIIIGFINKLINHLFFLGAFSVLSYFIFNIHINILFVGSYMTVLESGISMLKKSRKQV